MCAAAAAPRAQDHYWNVLQRTNTYTGRKYRDEPAIMVWDTRGVEGGAPPCAIEV